MAGWDISETYSLVQRAFNKRQAELARSCIQSVIDRENYARFHLHEARNLLKRFQRRYLLAPFSLMKVTIGTDAKAREAFEIFIIKTGAHVTAGIQSIHAISDILANAMYYSAGLNLGANPLPEKQIYLSNVSKMLKANSRFCSVGTILDQISSIPNYTHLSEASNRSKHSSIVKTSLNEDWTGKRANSHELHLSSFERNGIKFPEIEVFSLAGPAYNKLSIYVIEAGNCLNVSLKKIVP
jgi:hypothetical protein